MEKLTKKQIDEMIKTKTTDNNETEEHTELSASWSKIWLHCTQAIPLSKMFPAFKEDADYTLEGTEAHAVGELLLKDKIKPEQVPSEFAEVLDYYYKVKEIQADGNLLVEVKVDMTELLKSFTPISGRSDAVILAKDGGIDIIDLKWGKGVPVTAVDNEQLKLYAIGVVYFLSQLGLIDEKSPDLTTRITLHIIQPRLENAYTFYNMTMKELLEFHNFVCEQLQNIKNNKLVFDKGERCQFCKGKVFCPLYSKPTEMALTNYKTDLALISEENLKTLWNAKSDIFAFYKALEKYLRAQILLSKDGAFMGYKIIQVEGKRVVVDETALKEQFKAAGAKEDELESTSIIGISALDKLAKKYNIKKEDLKGVEKAKQDVIVSAIDSRDNIFDAETKEIE